MPIRQALSTQDISIHASRGGSDQRVYCNRYPRYGFQSTLPAGEATCDILSYTYNKSISIHASRGGSDKPAEFEDLQPGISIHASRGGSDKVKALKLQEECLFQSTLPAGEATGLSVPFPH